MANFLKNIFLEIKAQLTDTPSYMVKKAEAIPKSSPRLEHTRKQIEKALENPENKLIFITAPHGGGKGSSIRYFLKDCTRPYIIKSFVKIRDLDFAFLHMTSYIGRLFFLFFSLFFTYLLIKLVPQAGAIPFLLAIGYFFTKNAAGLIYIFYETFHNILFHKTRLVVIEDLERSSLSANDQWAMLSNLWQNKRVYIIAIGYPSGEQKEKLKIFESIMKLKGIVIEIPPCDTVNMTVAKERDPDFPFVQMKKESKETHDKPRSQQFPSWLSLFTPEELLLASNEVHLRIVAHEGCREATQEKKQYIYVEILLDWIAKKMGLQHNQIFFDIAKLEIGGIAAEVLSEAQKYYLQSFVESIDPSLGIKLNIR